MALQSKVKTNNFCQKADALRSEKLYQEAAANYLNAILIDRNNAQSYFGLGICYKNLKQYKKAIKYFQTAAKLKDDYFESYFELGVCYQLEGIPCRAIKSFIKALQINPESPEAILQLGISHELCEEEDMALMIYQKLIENTPEFPQSYEHKSQLLMKQNKFKEASIILNNLLKINPEHFEAYVGIGVCFEKLGKKTDAGRYYRKYLSKQPLSPESDFVKSRIDVLHSKTSHSHLRCLK